MGQAVQRATGVRPDVVEGRHVVVLEGVEGPVDIDPLTAVVLDLVDGARDAREIAARAVEASGGEATLEDAWSRLDLLADLGALTGRATPPVGDGRLSRRALLGRAAVGGATVVGFPIITAGEAAAHGGFLGGVLDRLLGPILGPVLGGEEHSKEQQAKQGQEELSKEQQGKQGQEELSKEQQAKQGQEEHSKEQQAKQGQEERSKEQQAKQP